MSQGRCGWCGHSKSEHNGAPQETKDRFAAQGPQGKFIRWTPTGCSRTDCDGCRKYETTGRTSDVNVT